MYKAKHKCILGKLQVQVKNFKKIKIDYKQSCKTKEIQNSSFILAMKDGVALLIQTNAQNMSIVMDVEFCCIIEIKEKINDF